MPELHELASILQTRVRRGQDGEPVIEGRRGNMHADGDGFSVFATFQTAKGLNRCRATLDPFCQIRQGGDTEAVWHMPALPTPEQAKVIRHALKLPKRRLGTPEQAARLQAFRFTRRTGHVRAPDSTILSQAGQQHQVAGGSAK